jgi:hypothetical protein
MSLTEAVLILAAVFALAVIGLSVAVRLGIGREFHKAMELRDEQRDVLANTRRNQQESREYLEESRKRTAQTNEELRGWADVMEERTKRNVERAERNQERWEKILSRAEVLLDSLEKR